MGFHSCMNTRIIKDETSLTMQSMEHESLCRKEDEERIISVIKPIAHGNICENLFVHGPSGSGKTTMIKHVLDDLGGYNRKLLCQHVNCWHYNTSMAIYVKIADALGEPVSRRGRATDEIFDRILETMRHENVGVLLVLDDIDGLLCRNDTKLFHNIAMAANNCAKFGIIGVSRDKNILRRLDPAILGSLRFIEIEVKGYSKEQLLELLSRRASMGLVDGSYSKDILEKIASIGVENEGNCRFALEAMRRAAKRAEQENRTQMHTEDVDAVTQRFGASQDNLTEEEQIIADLLRNGEKNTPEIYWLLRNKLSRTKRQIRNYLHSLEIKGVIESRFVRDKYNFGSKRISLTGRWQRE
ncbi:AAA family ATPase [Candidatus Micrarchaeota archaeon]|nr:AAA family ATPase [Candidatus Micrarchaeota archaeon]